MTSIIALTQWFNRILPISILSNLLLIGYLRYRRAISFRWRNLISLTSLVWALDLSIFIVAKLAFLFEENIPQILAQPTTIKSFLIQIRMGQTLLAQLIIAFVIAILGQTVRSRTGITVMAILVLLAIVPPALTGHSGNLNRHWIAISSWAVHITSVSIWSALVLALLYLTIRNSSDSANSAKIVSRISLFCFFSVLLSGTINAWVRVPLLSALWQTKYGIILLLKIGIFSLLGILGSVYRSKILTDISRHRESFSKLLALEIFLMALAVMLGVLLSGTPFPNVRFVAN